MSLKDLLQAIKEAFPEAMIVPQNFEDNHSPYQPQPSIEIVPCPRALIALEFSRSNILHCSISKVVIEGYGGQIYQSNAAIAKTIFSGDLPANENMDDIDYDFITKILKNYQSF